MNIIFRIVAGFLTCLQIVSTVSLASQESVLPFSVGEPEQLYTDVPGLPLNNHDFKRALTVVGAVDSTNDISPADAKDDPTESAGYYQGDIILDSLDEYNKVLKGQGAVAGSIRNAILYLEERWSNGVIPYVISSYYNDNQRARIAAAVITIHNHTCIRFVPRSTQKDYIHILNALQCSSRVGRKGGAQTVSLGPECLSLGIIMHEFMHTIGFWHEHSRWDRNEYIDIVWSNIPMGKDYNFDQLDRTRVQTLGVEYDYGSLLHYGPYAFSQNPNKPTIIPRQNVEIGQRRFFSKNDIYKINLLYECPRKPNDPGGCFDNNENCWIWEILDECENNSHWMKINCQRSCGVCGLRPLCTDKNFYCTAWAREGECETNVPYMNVFCPKSCDKCLQT